MDFCTKALMLSLTRTGSLGGSERTSLEVGVVELTSRVKRWEQVLPLLRLYTYSVGIIILLRCDSLEGPKRTRPSFLRIATLPRHRRCAATLYTQSHSLHSITQRRCEDEMLVQCNHICFLLSSTFLAS